MRGEVLGALSDGVEDVARELVGFEVHVVPDGGPEGVEDVGEEEEDES